MQKIVSDYFQAMANPLNMSDADKLAASLLMGCSAAVAFLLTIAVLCALVRVNRSNPYHIICISTGVADSMMLFIYATFCVYVGVSGDMQISTTTFGLCVGAAAVLCWYLTTGSILLCAINLFFGVTAGVRYRTYFTAKRTLCNVCFVWLFSLFVAAFYLFPGCDFVFDPYWMVWNWDNQECSQILALTNWYYCIFVSSAVIFFNCATVVQLRMAHKVGANPTTDVRQRYTNKVEREKRFFKQALINAIVQEMTIFSFYYMVTFAKTTFQVFLGTSYMVLVAHAANSVVLVIFHTQVRQFFNTYSVVRKTEVKPTPSQATTRL